MDTSSHKLDRAFLLHWIVGTSVAWILGLTAAFIVAHFVASVFRTRESNLVVGLCLGAAVGFAQRLALKKRLPVNGWWVLAGSVGLGIPFMLLEALDASGVPGIEALENQLLSRTLIWGVLGGLLSATLQLHFLRPFLRAPVLWFVVNSVGWGLCWLLCSLPDSLALIGALIGGAVAGSVTGIGLLLMFQFHSLDHVPLE